MSHDRVRTRRAHPLATRRRAARGRRWIDPAGGHRHHRDPAHRGDPPRLRRQRIARTQDPGGIDPGGSRDLGLGRATRIPRPSLGSPSQLEREAMRLSRIVADLLDLSRLGVGKRPRSIACGLDAARARRGRASSMTARRRRACRSTTQPTTSPPVSGSPRDLSLLVRNLIDNAIRYTRPTGGSTSRVMTGDDTIDTHRGRRRHGHPEPRPPAGVRALLPRRPGALSGDGRHGPGPGHREARRREPRGLGRGRRASWAQARRSRSPSRRR